MNRDLIENHLKNLESLEKHKISSENKKEIKFKKLKKIETSNISLYDKIKFIPNFIYSSAKYSYLFSLSMILYFIVFEKQKSFLEIFKENEAKNIL